MTTIKVPSWAISLAAGFGDLEESERELLESIDKVHVLAIEDNDLNAKNNLHKEFCTYKQKRKLRGITGCV